MNELIISDGQRDWDYSTVTLETFDSSEWLEYLADVFITQGQTALNMALEKFARAGNKVGFRSAKKYWTDYLEEFAASTKTAGSEFETEFSNQPIKLKSGKWTCDDLGVRSFDFRLGEMYACRHPILPVERIVNVDTGFEQIRLAFRRGHRWNQSVIAPKSTLASPNKIIELADRGISVTADNAKPLISFLQEVEDLNYNDIPVARSTARLGWISDTEFSPYAPDLTFDDTTGFGRQFRSIDQVGDYELWKDTMRFYRKQSLIYKIMIGASIGSAFLKKLDVLPAFVHINTNLTSTGKSVALMSAASVWGNPEAGEYLQSFNSTTVAMERMAEFYNSMPLCLDELQQAKDSRGQKHFSVYKLSQGSGRARSTKVGGLEKTPTWANFILTTGESPLVEAAEGEGAMARVINIEIDAPITTREQSRAILDVIKNNYGYAGRSVIEHYNSGQITDEKLKLMYESFSELLSRFPDMQDKQVMSAAAILVGDCIASDYIFNDGGLTPAQIAPYLTTRSATSIGNRAYEFIRGWIAQNANRFMSEEPGSEVAGDLYGRFGEDRLWIIGSVFDKALRDAGFSPDAVLSDWRRKDYIATGDKTKVPYRIGGSLVRCVCLLNEPEEGQMELGDMSDFEL